MARLRSYPGTVIDSRDLKIDVYSSRDHASGASDSLVRVTHIPSGIVAFSRDKASEAEDRHAAIAEIEVKLADLGRQRQ